MISNLGKVHHHLLCDGFARLDNFMAHAFEDWEGAVPAGECDGLHNLENDSLDFQNLSTIVNIDECSCLFVCEKDIFDRKPKCNKLTTLSKFYSFLFYQK